MIAPTIEDYKHDHETAHLLAKVSRSLLAVVEENEKLAERVADLEAANARLLEELVEAERGGE